MLRSPTHVSWLVLAGLLAAGCATGDTVVERTYTTNEFVSTGPSARIELVHAAYLPRGVEFEVSLTNLTDTELSLERDGILFAYQGLEYPLDLDTDDTPRRRVQPAAENAIPDRLRLRPGERHRLRIEFRLGRAMSETGWVVLRGISGPNGYLDPLWLEVPPAPSRKAQVPSSRPVG